MYLKNRIRLIILFVSIISIILLNHLFSHRPILETIAQIAPSNILIIYRFDFLTKFLFLSGFLFINIVIFSIGLFWLIVVFIKNRHHLLKFRIILLEIGIIALLPGIVLSSRWIKSRIFFVQGYKEYQIREDQKAINFWQKSIKLAPTFPTPCLELMTYYENNNNYQEAINVGKQFLRNGIDHQILNRMGHLSSFVKDYHAGIKYYQRALELKESSEIEYKLASLYFELSKLQYCNQICLKYPSKSQFLLLYAKSLCKQNMIEKALTIISSAISMDDSNPESWYVQGKIFSSLNKTQNAFESLKHAIWLKKEFPKVYIEMAKLFINNNQAQSAVEFLKKAIYYDNTLSDVYVLLQMIKHGNILTLKRIEKKMDIKLEFFPSELLIEKNESADFTIKLQHPVSYNNIQLEFIEPYGWGISCKIINIKTIGYNQYEAHYTVTGKRDNKVNLGNSWKINFIAYDVKEGKYNDNILNVRVRDTDEGKILFAITEDFECSEGPHKNDTTPSRNDLSVQETEIDLIKKSYKADSLANSFGVKWSHIADLGSSFLRINWLAKVSQDSGWQQIWHSLKHYYINSAEAGNDIQLHIHSYSIPASPNFSGLYDRKTNQLVISSGEYRLSVPFPDGHFGAWANTYFDLGYFDNITSRIGSLFLGISSYENLLHENNPDHRIIFFRAGEWEFGETEEEMRKSVIALNKNNILAGSDAYRGNFNKRMFSFNKRIGDNTYFCAFENIRKPALSLLDIGILQILPVTELQHYSHVRPIDNSFSSKTMYDLCFNENGKIKAGVHLLVEMYHINRINFGDKNWDSLDTQYGDWKRLNNHFKEFSRHATKVKFVTISQAILDYLDYYTPDILALRVNEQKINDKTYTYDIKFIGTDILTDETHQHFVSIKPPSYLLTSINKIVLFLNEEKVNIWENITSYEDLEFKAKAKSGYRMEVTLCK